MPSEYDRFGIRFMYPENWSLSEDQPDSWPKGISVHSPTGAFWTLAVHFPLEEPLHLANAAIDEFRSEYSDLEAEEVREDSSSFAGRDVAAYDLNFYCLDFLITAQIRAWKWGNRAFLLLTQAESREFEELKPIFAAITHSLFQGFAAET